MVKTVFKLSAAIALLTTASFTNAARDPSIEYASELQNVKLQFPKSEDELCETNSSAPDCIGFHDSNAWWMHDDNNYVMHKINDKDPHRNELRNYVEFNMMTTNKTFTGTLSKVAVSNLNHVTILQVHTSEDKSKPVLRIQYDRPNDQYEMVVAKDEKANNGYCKEVYSTSGSGPKAFSITLRGKGDSRIIRAAIGGQAHTCDISDWPSQKTYYFKMGTYLSDGNGSAEWRFKDWNWNQ